MHIQLLPPPGWDSGRASFRCAVLCCVGPSACCAFVENDNHWRSSRRSYSRPCPVARPPMLAEELNRAYANHEIVGDYLTACLAWFEAGGTLPLAGLVQQVGCWRTVQSALTVST